MCEFEKNKRAIYLIENNFLRKKKFLEEYKDIDFGIWKFLSGLLGKEKNRCETGIQAVAIHNCQTI